HHDGEQVTHMERGARAVVAHISGEPVLERSSIDALEIGGLVDEPPLGKHLQKFGFRRVHRVSLTVLSQMCGPSTSFAPGFHAVSTQGALSIGLVHSTFN